MPRILVVEDDVNTCAGLEEILAEEGYEVETAPDGHTALDKIDDSFDVLLSDLRLPGIRGLELARRIVADYPDVVPIIMTAYGSPEMHNRGKEIGIYAWLTKPLNLERLLTLLKQAPLSKDLRQDQKVLSRSAVI